VHCDNCLERAINMKTSFYLTIFLYLSHVLQVIAYTSGEKDQTTLIEDISELLSNKLSNWVKTNLPTFAIKEDQLMPDVEDDPDNGQSVPQFIIAQDDEKLSWRKCSNSDKATSNCGLNGTCYLTYRDSRELISVCLCGETVKLNCTASTWGSYINLVEDNKNDSPILLLETVPYVVDNETFWFNETLGSDFNDTIFIETNSTVDANQTDQFLLPSDNVVNQDSSQLDVLKINGKDVKIKKEYAKIDAGW